MRRHMTGRLRVLMLGGVVPWHPKAGGGQIIAYKTSEALALAGHRLHYLAIAPKGYERQVNWGEVEYAPRGLGLQEALRLAPQLARSSQGNEYASVPVHLATDHSGYFLGH